MLTRFLRRRHVAPAAPTRAAFDAPTRAETPPGNSDLERGLRDIHQTDAGFDPSRFAGYAGMVFRLVQRAWMTRDIASLRDRVTPEMHDALQTQCDRVRSAGRTNRVAEIEITATVTEAWQESGRDYVTAYIEGSIVDYAVDEVSDRLVAGSKTVPRGVEEFWTFTRPAGLNFWMLSAIQTP
jgi:predicted lipid-binding transport protein (Tim44 family)